MKKKVSCYLRRQQLALDKLKVALFTMIKVWWEGKYCPPPKAHPEDLIFVLLGHYKKHWTSKFAHAVLNYFVRHQAWIVPTLITVVVTILLDKF